MTGRSLPALGCSPKRLFSRSIWVTHLPPCYLESFATAQSSGNSLCFRKEKPTGMPNAASPGLPSGDQERFDARLPEQYACPMDIARAQESLRAAELCLQSGLVNSAVSRAYYAMFQAAQVALETEGIRRPTWSHPSVQALFTTELIHRRKRYAATFRDYLAAALVVRQAADYGRAGVSHRIAQRQVRRAALFVTAVQEVLNA